MQVKVEVYAGIIFGLLIVGCCILCVVLGIWIADMIEVSANKRQDYEYCQSRFLISTQKDNTQLVSFNSGTNWAYYVDGEAIGQYDISKGVPIVDRPRPYRFYRDSIRTTSGSTLKISYRLYSIDGGIHWAFYDENDILIGDGRYIEDEALKEAWGWNVISEHVRKHGSISDLSNPVVKKALRDAGITVYASEE